MSGALLYQFLFMVGPEEIAKYSSHRRTHATSFCLGIVYIVEYEVIFFWRPISVMHEIVFWELSNQSVLCNTVL